MTATVIYFQDKAVACDAQGFLQDYALWNEEIAVLLAKNDQIELTVIHWQVLRFLRGFYLQYKHFPTMRVFIKLLNETYVESSFNSEQLHLLFPQGVLKQAAKFAGLPKPPHCM